MVRLLTVKASVAVLKRALVVSDRLRPATWRALAVALATLAALSFWGYARTSRKYERALSGLEDKTPYLNALMLVPSAARSQRLGLGLTHAQQQAAGSYYALVIGNQSYAGQSPLKTVETDTRGVTALLGGFYGFETKLLIDARPDSISALHAHSRTLGPEDNLFIYFAGHGIRDAEIDSTPRFNVLDSSPTADFSSAVATATTLGGHPPFFIRYAHLARPDYTSLGSSFHPHFGVGGGNAAFDRPSFAAAWSVVGFDFQRLVRHTPTVLLQLPPAENDSFLATLQKLALLIQAIVLTIGSAFASAFGWIAYHRGKVELALKRKQLRLAELELEERGREIEEKRIRLRLAQMELEDRERARAEEAARRAAAEPRIVVVSC